MDQCRATKASGERCKGVATGADGLCWAHAPENAAQRHRRASKAAKSKPNRGVREIKELCRDLTERVLSGELLPGPAAVVNQIQNTILRAIEQERKNRELEEVIERIERLEALQRNSGGRRWG
jgi:hypothetical protein